MANGISVVCFAASYAVAWALELVSLRFRYGWHRAVMLAIAAAVHSAGSGALRIDRKIVGERDRCAIGSQHFSR